MTVALEKFDPTKTYAGLKKAGKGGFDCGHKLINDFVAGSLKQQVQARSSVAWVLTDDANLDQNGNPFLVGFYTWTMMSVDQSLLVHLGSKLPKLVPCVRLVMLGVDKNYKGQKWGTDLMRHALGNTRALAAQVGCRGMYLDADAGAYDFYVGLGFKSLDATGGQAPGGVSTPMFIFLEGIPADI
ncbi:MAG: GNAT family N-acetyltransferase [Burkholderiaceae bacterium]|nr:GNAT family N-acetyltransferase [Burkholderiaceae bacterium]